MGQNLGEGLEIGDGEIEVVICTWVIRSDARDERRPQSMGGRCAQIPCVRGDHHGARRLQAEAAIASS